MRLLIILAQYWCNVVSRTPLPGTTYDAALGRGEENKGDLVVFGVDYMRRGNMKRKEELAASER